MLAGSLAQPSVFETAAITRLTLADFRSYAWARLDLESAPVVLTGPNGAGKTNLLEAISFLAPGRGLRRAALSEVDRRGRVDERRKPWAVAARLESPSGAFELGTGRASDGGEDGERRVVRVDGMAARGQVAFARLVAITWVTPEMDRLFTGGRAGRRRFLDRMVGGFDPEHAGRIAAYDHALRERGRLLRGGRDVPQAEPGWLAALEDRMAREGAAIAAARRDLVQRLNAAARAPARGFPRAAALVRGTLEDWLESMPSLATEDRFRGALEASRAEDASTGGCALGPQRSDLEVRDLDQGWPAASCSTGEQKALLVSLVLAHGRLHAAERGAPPVLLLDEIGAHLDAGRRALLFKEIVGLGMQAWMTGTEDSLFAPLDGRAQRFRVVDSRVMRA